MQAPFHAFRRDRASVFLHEDPRASGEAAALRAARLIRQAIADRGMARVMVGTGNSQVAVIDALVRCDLDWSRVEVFHMDEYIGLSADHSASFRRWLKRHVADRRRVGAVHYLDGNARDLTTEIARYSRLLTSAPLDLAFVGFGENGHIAFNDPPSDLSAPALLEVVTLALECRLQQVGEGHFRQLADVPEQALTVTGRGLALAAVWLCCVPERRKAAAVRDALEGPISPDCPASYCRRHPSAFVYLDPESAELLSASCTRPD